MNENIALEAGPTAPDARRVWSVFTSNISYITAFYIILRAFFYAAARLASGFALGPWLYLLASFLAGIWLETVLFIKIFGQTRGKEPPLREMLPEGLRRTPAVALIFVVRFAAVLLGHVFLFVPGVYLSAATAYALPLCAVRADAPLMSSFRLTRRSLGLLFSVYFCLFLLEYGLVFYLAIRYGGSLLAQGPNGWLLKSLAEHPARWVLGYLAWGLAVALGRGLFQSFITVACSDALGAEETSSSGRPESPLSVLAKFALAGLAALGLFFAAIMGFGIWAATSGGGKAMMQTAAKFSTPVVVQGKTILMPPKDWHVSPETYVPQSAGTAFRLDRLDVPAPYPQVKLYWFPMETGRTIPKEDSGRFAGQVIARVNAAEKDPLPSSLRAFKEKLDSGFQTTAVSPTQISGQPAWVADQRYAGRCRRLHFLPFMKGLLALSEEYNCASQTLQDDSLGVVLRGLALSGVSTIPPVQPARRPPAQAANLGFAGLGLETDVAALRNVFPRSTHLLRRFKGMNLVREIIFRLMNRYPPGSSLGKGLGNDGYIWSEIYSRNPGAIGPDGQRHQSPGSDKESGSLDLRGSTSYEITFASEEDPGHVHWVRFELNDGRVNNARISLEKHVPTPGANETSDGGYFLSCQAVRDSLEKHYGAPVGQTPPQPNGLGRNTRTITWADGQAELGLECLEARDPSSSRPLAHLINVRRLSP